MGTCAIIAPRQSDMIGERDDGYLAECILEGVHGYGPHVFRTPEGKLYAWEDDKDCGCCNGSTDEPCAVYTKIKEEEIPIYQEGGPR